jgi:SAM-dependent methyltransferase
MSATPPRPDWDARYAEPGFVYGTEPNDFLSSVVDRLPHGRALSLGEGEGRNAVFLARAGWHVIAVDRSRVGLRKATVLAAQRGVPVAACVADLAAFPLPATWFDVIVSIFCHLPRELRRRVHGAAVRALRPGGMLVLEAYTPCQLAFGTGGPSVPELLATVEDLRTDLAGLTFIIARECEREVIEGRFHRGRGAVVQVLAVREAP